MKIAYVGMSHLGYVTGVSVASTGKKVVGFDTNSELIDRLNRGELPVHEPDLEEKLSLAKDQLEFSSRWESIQDCDLIYVARDVRTNVCYQLIEGLLELVAGLVFQSFRRKLEHASFQLSYLVGEIRSFWQGGRGRGGRLLTFR